MTALMGRFGALVDLKCDANLDRTSGGVAYSSQTSVTGRRVNAQLIASRRVWNLTNRIGSASELGALETFMFGGFGPGPFYFVPPDAPFANLVTPWDSAMGGSSLLATPAPAGWGGLGARVMPDGAVVPSVLGWATGGTEPAGPRLTSSPVPVMPGDTITVSAYVQGTDARVLAFGADVNGSFGSSIGTTDPVTSATMVRQSKTIIVPAGVFGVWVSCDNATQVGGWDVTWTSLPVPYAVGRGCTSAVLDQAQFTAVLAGPNGSLDDSHYVVTELG